MKATTKIFHVIIWLALTLAGFNLRAAKEPLYDGLGSYSRKITTDSPEAQRYFDQGFGFSSRIQSPRGDPCVSASRGDSIPNAQWRTGASRSPAVRILILSAVPPPAAELAWKELELAQKNAG